MSFLISNAWADAAAPLAGQPSPLQQFMAGPFFIVFIFVVFYLLMIRPQMKRAKEHKRMLSSIAKGDEVVTNGGLVGKVREIGENLVVVEIANQVEVRVQRPSISGVLPKGTMTSL
jgi:preprotein translocase subunit YajC